MSNMNIVNIAACALVLLLVPIVFMNLFENVDAGELVMIQYPGSGVISWNTQPGWAFQGFGKTQSYPRRITVPYEKKLQFNDFGYGTAKGSLQIELPLDPKMLTKIHMDFGSPEAMIESVVKPTVDKSVFASGTLMSSRESVSERRNDLMRFAEDQIVGGIYRTTQAQVQVIDPLNEKQTKTVTVTEIVQGKDGKPVRQEIPAFDRYRLKTFNFALNELDYDPKVLKQIQDQQALAMRVQTSIAEAKQAEQQSITVAKQGEAHAAEAKWAQEVIKAQAVTKAEQEREVARLENETAEFNRQKAIKEGQGEAEKKRLIMAADGALTQRLAAQVEINKAYAAAIQGATQPLVPGVVMGGKDGSQNTVPGLIEMLMVKTAKELGLK